MEIPVLIEPVAGNGYRARGGEPFGVTAEGATPDEAMRHFAQAVQSRLSAGAEIRPFQLPPTEHPSAPLVGWLRGDPMLEAWRNAMAEHRRKLDEEEGLP